MLLSRNASPTMKLVCLAMGHMVQERRRASLLRMARIRNLPSIETL